MRYWIFPQVLHRHLLKNIVMWFCQAAKDKTFKGGELIMCSLYYWRNPLSLIKLATSAAGLASVIVITRKKILKFFYHFKELCVTNWNLEILYCFRKYFVTQIEIPSNLKYVIIAKIITITFFTAEQTWLNTWFKM